MDNVWQQLQGLVRGVQERFSNKQQTTRHRNINPKYYNEIPQRFSGFVNDAGRQVTSIAERFKPIQPIQIDPAAVQQVGKMFNNFQGGIKNYWQDVDTTDVAKRFASSQPVQTALKIGNDYNPANQDLNAPINSGKGLFFDTRRFFIEQNKNNPAYQAYAKSQRAWHTGEKLTEEESNLATEQMSYQIPIMGMGKVAGAVGNVAKQAAFEKLKGLMTYEDSLIKSGVAKDLVKKLSYEDAKGLLKAMPKNKETEDLFRGWVNTRRAAPLEGLAQARQFRQLDSEGMEGIFQFQKNKNPAFAPVKAYFDTKYKSLAQQGVRMGYKPEYLPQLWANSEKEVVETLGQFLTKNPSFTFASVIKNYEQGIAAGLKPRFNKVSDLVGWYETKANKALADRRFFDTLLKAGHIQPAETAPKGWVRINAEGFPKDKVNTDVGMIDRTYSAPKDLAQSIDNYLKHDEGIIKRAADYVSSVKNIGLSAGVPGTAMNAHGYNIFIRGLMSSKNPLGQLMTKSHWFVAPKAAEGWLNKNLDRATYFAKHGMTITTEDHAFTQAAEEMSKSMKIRQLWASWFETPLFSRTLPALKTDYADRRFGH